MKKGAKKTNPFNPNIFKFKEKKQRWSLNLIFSLVVFIILLSAIGMAAAAVYVLVKVKLLSDMNDSINISLVILLMSVISLFLGTTIVFFSSKVPLKPINNLINKMNQLSAGDFKARLEFGAALDNHPAFREITTSFNKMAEELENTELLRRDFINNFSHEFKTPIVSIAGFVKLLSKGNLTNEQEKMYLRSIEEESMRLSYMATNVLNLTKVENQIILSGITRYNLSEQIRSAVLLLEGKWSKKSIDLYLDFDEYMIDANEELLKEVWINLIDNAVKFSASGGTVALEIEAANGEVRVSVSNTGSEIPPEKMDKIFNKFYQADESRSSEGNGVGLAIVKKITELHEGTVTVKSENGVTTFTVELLQNRKK